MKYIGNLPEFNIVHSSADQYDYVNPSDPPQDVNPSSPYCNWLNITTGAVFICISNAVGANTWAKSGGGVDVVSAVNPDEFANPAAVGSLWVNYTSGEVFVCTDNTTDANFWQGQLGTKVKPYSMPSSTLDQNIDLTGLYGNVSIIGGNLYRVLTNNTYIVEIYDGLTTTLLKTIPKETDSSYFAMRRYGGSKMMAACNGSPDRFDLFSSDETLAVETELASPYDIPRDVCDVGTGLVSIDSHSNKVYVHEGYTAVVDHSFALPTASYCHTICWDGRNLIIGKYDAGSHGDNIFIMNGISSTILSQFTYYGQTRPENISYHEDHLYVYSKDDEYMRRFKNENEL